MLPNSCHRPSRPLSRPCRWHQGGDDRGGRAGSGQSSQADDAAGAEGGAASATPARAFLRKSPLSLSTPRLPASRERLGGQNAGRAGGLLPQLAAAGWPAEAGARGGGQRSRGSTTVYRNCILYDGAVWPPLRQEAEMILGAEAGTPWPEVLKVGGRCTSSVRKCNRAGERAGRQSAAACPWPSPGGSLT